MKINYIYLTILIFCTVVLTFFLSFLYKRDEIKTSYSYEKLNKITATEFKEYMIEHPDTIIYIADKNNLNYNKFEKKLINVSTLEFSLIATNSIILPSFITIILGKLLSLYT